MQGLRNIHSECWMYKYCLASIDFVTNQGHGYSASNYMYKVNSRSRGEICSKLTIKTPERLYCYRSGIFIINFEYISHLVLAFLLLTLSR